MEELASAGDPAWPSVQAWITAARTPVTTLPVTTAARESCLHRLQVTVGSTLGALAWHVGGLVIDHGWLRVLGGGTPDLPDLATASGLGEPGPGSAPPPFVVVALDVLGGRFAINGGGLPGAPGDVAYFAPDTLGWESLGMGHSQFVAWCLTGDTTSFYASLRWPGWERETSGLSLAQGLSLYPPLWTREANADLAATSRSAVPWQELLDLQQDVAGQLDGGP